jgi:ABC-2 type transport system ATP-binding protein
VIRLEAVTKTFGTKRAVDDLSLEVRPGEVFAMLGPNGAGKTTTIKMIAGLVRPTSGRVLVGGVDVVADPIAAKRILGYVPDQPYLYEKLTGREFLHFVSEVYERDGSAGREAMERWIRTFGMEEWIDTLVETYSHGMRQRVVLSATLLHEPEVLLVDEPLVGLDPQTARLVREIFREQARAGRTVLLSTHLLSIAETAADRIGIMRNGRLVAVGTLEDLRARVRRDASLEEIFLDVTGRE